MTDTTTSPATELQLWTNLTNSQIYLLDGNEQSASFSVAAWATWTAKMKTGYYTLQPSGSKNVIGACFDNSGSSNFLRFFLFATPNSGGPDFQGGNTQWTGCVTIPYFVLCRTCHVNSNGDIMDGE
ncbi:hypothetical protein TWF103_006122 [Orbilia oligospora]|nr:hypothetical protein TWF103_006122 [Orbilia oligospora]